MADKFCTTPTAVAQEIIAPFLEVQNHILQLLEQLSKAVEFKIKDHKTTITDNLEHINDLISQSCTNIKSAI